MSPHGREKSIFENVTSCVGYSVSLWEEIWLKKITQKHPDMVGREKDVEETIKNPSEVHENYCAGRTNVLYWGSYPNRPPREKYLKVATCIRDQVKNESIVLTAHASPFNSDARMYGGKKIWPN